MCLYMSVCSRADMSHEDSETEDVFGKRGHFSLDFLSGPFEGQDLFIGAGQSQRGQGATGTFAQQQQIFNIVGFY